MSKLQYIAMLWLAIATSACAANEQTEHNQNNQTSAKPMTPVDLLEVSKISNSQLAADGKSAIYLKNKLNWQRNRWVNQLWRYQIVSDESRQLTFGENSVSNPVISPNSKLVAFLTSRHNDKHRQIYLMHLDGGEAFKLTDLDQSANQLTWSNNSQYLYFTARVPTSKQEKKLQKNKASISAFEDPDNKRALWRVNIDSGKVEQLTKARQSIVYFQLSPSNNTILLSKAPAHLLDQRHKAELWLMDLADNSQKQLTSNNYYERNAKFSPDSKAIIYAATVNGQADEYYNNNLFVYQLKPAKHQILTEGFAGEVESFAWAKRADIVYFTANTGVSTHLYQVSQKTGQITQLSAGDWTINEWSYQREQDKHLIEKRSVTEPGDLWLADVNDQSLNTSRLTKHYANIQEQFVLPKQQRLRWPSHDGVIIEGLLTYPLNYQQGQRFPLVVQTHGGPRSSDQFGLWSTTSYLPVLAAKGYGVLKVNHRGSTGYGDEFLRDMVGGYFNNAHLDVLAGVDYVIEQGLADQDKLVKMGWSAGGHMTNKLITFTNRFKAASSGAGTVDWVSMYGETDAAYMRTWWFNGKPWQKDAPIANYNKDSVISELWKVQTPTLIFVGEKDVRVPSTQSKMLFRGLRDLGVDTELYIAPGEPHGYRKPKHRLFKINKELEWFDRYIHNKTYHHQEIPD